MTGAAAIIADDEDKRRTSRVFAFEGPSEFPASPLSAELDGIPPDL